MKVLHLIPSLDQGGAERLLVDLCDHAGLESEQVIVILFGPIFFVPRCARVRSIDFPRRLTLTTLPRAMRSLLRLRALVAEERPDLVHGWLYYGNLLTVILGGLAPHIVWSIHHTTFGPARSIRLVRLARWLGRLASGYVPDRIVYCAEAARRLHESDGYCARKSSVIHNGVALGRFAPSGEQRRDTRAQLALADDELVIGHFARFDPQKNFRLACAAVARARPHLGPFKLLLAGRDVSPANSELQALLDSHGLVGDAKLLGAVDHIERYINAVDIMMLGSSYGEALPIVLIEAAVCERAVVTTDVGDVSMLGLSPESVVPPDDVEGFARALTREAAAWRDGSSAARRAAVAARVRGSLSIEACSKAYEETYRDVLRPPGSNRSSVSHTRPRENLSDRQSPQERSNSNLTSASPSVAPEV
jgi:glycosyltransferase involved in cell wall biosynthesis